MIYISHVNPSSVYGAATSLNIHLQSLSIKYDHATLFYRVGLLEFINLSITSSFIKSNKKISYIPFISSLDRNYDYALPTGFKLVRFKISDLINSFFNYFSFFIIMSYIRNNDIKCVHFNSHVLLSLSYKISSNPNIKTFMHIRDFLKENITYFDVYKFSKLGRLIFIDEAVKKNFFNIVSSYPLKNTDIIQNPFVMPSLSEATPFEFSADTNKVVFAYVGSFITDKGALKILKSFLSSNVDSSLILVGNGDDFDEILNLSKFNSNIFVYKDFDSLSKSDFYYKIDYLIRGDNTFRTGRTVYEALFVGAYVILPGDTSKVTDLDLMRFSSQIYYYRPSAFDALANLIKSLSVTKPVKTKPLLSNIDDYVSNMSSIYNKLC